MKIVRCQTAEELGLKVASETARALNEAIAEKGVAYLLVSTGASQFTTFEALLKEDVDWGKVEMFHLDEYLDMPDTHPASFIKYLKERFANHINLKAAHYVDTSIGADEIIARLTRDITAKPIDIGLIGIGENTHIAFNDPPADFEDESAFKIVKLDEACRMQQFGEGWFPTLEDVPTLAISMTVKQILRCKRIISAVPYKVKAEAVYKTLTAKEITPDIPATALRWHDDVTLYLDADSASLID